MIAMGKKTIETRKWFTRYRGDILIVASKKPKIPCLPTGKALCIVEICECRKMKLDDETAACCEIYSGAFAWVLKNIRPVPPFVVKGKLGIYEVDFNIPIGTINLKQHLSKGLVECWLFNEKN